MNGELGTVNGEVGAAHLLTIVETDDEFIVCWGGELSDWVARFQKQEGFPARMWAERMMGLYMLSTPAEGTLVQDHNASLDGSNQ